MNKISSQKYLCFLPFILLFFGCNFQLSKPIETKKETMDAIIGKWEHVDQRKSDVRNIVFTNTKGKNGYYTCVLTFNKKGSNGNISELNYWRYADIGKIELYVNLNFLPLPITFLDNQTFDLNQDDIYTKDK